MARPVFRIEPKLPPEAMKTYAIVAPKDTHWRDATCAEVECGAWRAGWVTTVDTATPLGAKQANYIRLHSGRHFTPEEAHGSSVVKFWFPPGQTCFQPHRIRLEREEIYLVRGGDHRGNPRGEAGRRHARAVDWVDDFANHQQTLADRLKQG